MLSRYVKNLPEAYESHQATPFKFLSWFHSTWTLQFVEIFHTCGSATHQWTNKPWVRRDDAERGGRLLKGVLYTVWWWMNDTKCHLQWTDRTSCMKWSHELFIDLSVLTAGLLVRLLKFQSVGQALSGISVKVPVVQCHLSPPPFSLPLVLSTFPGWEMGGRLCKGWL